MKNLQGMKFHSLSVLNLHGEDVHHRKIWLCRCDCGKEKPIPSRHLLSGAVITCGCKIGVIFPKPNLGKKGSDCGTWKGGRFLRSDGYIMVYMGYAKYEMEHRVIYEKAHGSIPYDCIIHHRNEIKTDNRIENLEMMTRKDHAEHHRLGDHGCRENLIHAKKYRKIC
jgi:hypothetical protein